VTDADDLTPLQPGLRKRPAQQRSQERVEHILDAAGALVAQHGYAAVTTSRIARRAKVAPGTLYEFFTDKRAVVQAAAARNLERFGQRVDEALLDNHPGDVREAARLILDVYIDMSREDHAFRAVRFGDVVDKHLFDPELDNDALVGARYAALVSRVVGIEDTPELRRALVLAVKIVDVLVEYAFDSDAQGDRWVLDRTRLLVDEHLARLD
jgi:AcrR family transcriptional regulator